MLATGHGGVAALVTPPERPGVRPRLPPLNRLPSRQNRPAVGVDSRRPARRRASGRASAIPPRRHAPKTTLLARLHPASTRDLVSRINLRREHRENRPRHREQAHERIDYDKTACRDPALAVPPQTLAQSLIESARRKPSRIRKRPHRRSRRARMSVWRTHTDTTSAGSDKPPARRSARPRNRRTPTPSARRRRRPSIRSGSRTSRTPHPRPGDLADRHVIPPLFRHQPERRLQQTHARRLLAASAARLAMRRLPDGGVRATRPDRSVHERIFPVRKNFLHAAILDHTLILDNIISYESNLENRSTGFLCQHGVRRARQRQRVHCRCKPVPPVRYPVVRQADADDGDVKRRPVLSAGRAAEATDLSVDRRPSQSIGIGIPETRTACSTNIGVLIYQQECRRREVGAPLRKPGASPASPILFS